MSAPRFARWQQATGDSLGARPGARVLMYALLARFIHAVNWGIYSPRKTVLGNLSAHSEGRALDLGCSRGVGENMVRYLLDLGPWQLGISVIIHDGRIYSARSPEGRPYAGDEHADHVHIEMTRKAASHLRLARALRVLDL